MRFKNLFILPLLFSGIIITGCNNNSQDTPDEHFDPEDYICEGGTYSGYFDEINMGRKLCSNSYYELYFQSSLKNDKSYTVKISKPELAKVENQSNTSFKLVTTAKKGSFILTIKNANGVLVYRNQVKVETPCSIDKLGDKLFNSSTFVTDPQYIHYLGDWRLMFVSDNPITGSFVGGDDLEQDVTITFSFTESDLIEFIDYRDAYFFSVTTISSTSAGDTSIGYLQIARALDVIYIYETSGYLLTYVSAQ